MNKNKCGCSGCNNIATHTWSGHPTCNACSANESRRKSGDELYINLGSITVLDRLTGFSGYQRDIESGFRDLDGKFWLASGNKDVRRSDAKTIGEAIEWIKSRSNTCEGV